ncbi:MAG: glycosyltransferase family 2 protein [bacterium]
MYLFDLSIIIVSWNVRKYLKICLDSIIRYTQGLNYEIIIVDNNSGDGTADEVRDTIKKYEDIGIIFIQNVKNDGFSKANNIGLEKAKGEYILFLNPDTEIKDNGLKILSEFLNKNPKYGAVGCRILYPDGSIYHPCARGFPTPLKILYHMMFFTKFFPKSKKFCALNLEYWDKNENSDIECLVGAFILVRHVVLEQVGSFRDIFFMYGEDIDLCYRVIKGGWKIKYIADSYIVHHTEKSSEQVDNNHFKSLLIAHSNWLFHRINYGIGYGCIYRFVILIGALFRSFIAGIMFLVFSVLGFKNKASLVRNLFIRYLKLLRWALGMEGWVKDVGHSA